MKVTSVGWQITLWSHWQVASRSSEVNFTKNYTLLYLFYPCARFHCNSFTGRLSQKCISCLQHWFLRNHLLLNGSKSEAIIIGTAQRHARLLQPPQMSVAGNCVAVSTQQESVTSVYHERLWYNLLISWPSCYGQHGPTNSVINWSRLVTLQWSGLWDVISLQTPCWEIGGESRSRIQKL